MGIDDTCSTTIWRHFKSQNSRIPRKWNASAETNKLPSCSVCDFSIADKLVPLRFIEINDSPIKNTNTNEKIYVIRLLRSRVFGCVGGPPELCQHLKKDAE